MSFSAFLTPAIHLIPASTPTPTPAPPPPSPSDPPVPGPARPVPPPKNAGAASRTHQTDANATLGSARKKKRGERKNGGGGGGGEGGGPRAGLSQSVTFPGFINESVIKLFFFFFTQCATCSGTHICLSHKEKQLSNQQVRREMFKRLKNVYTLIISPLLLSGAFPSLGSLIRVARWGEVQQWSAKILQQMFLAVFKQQILSSLEATNHKMQVGFVKRHWRLPSQAQLNAGKMWTEILSRSCCPDTHVWEE